MRDETCTQQVHVAPGFDAREFELRVRLGQRRLRRGNVAAAGFTGIGRPCPLRVELTVVERGQQLAPLHRIALVHQQRCDGGGDACAHRDRDARLHGTRATDKRAEPAFPRRLDLDDRCAHEECVDGKSGSESDD